MSRAFLKSCLCLMLSTTTVVHGFLVLPNTLSLSAVASSVKARKNHRLHDGRVHYSKRSTADTQMQPPRRRKERHSQRNRKRGPPRLKDGKSQVFTAETLYQPLIFRAFDPANKDLESREEALSRVPHERALTTILNTWAKSNVPDAADRCYELLRHLKNDHYRESLAPNGFVYSVVSKAYAMRSQPARAQAVLEEHMDDEKADPPSSFFFNAVMTSWIKSNPGEAPEQCKRLLAQMKTLVQATGTKDCAPTVISYSILINALAKRGKAREAEEELQDMIKEGITPNVITFSAVVNAWARSDDPDATQHCRQLIHEMQKLARKEGDPTLGPNAVTYNTLLSALSKRGQAQEAEETLKEMATAGIAVNQISFATVMTAWSKSGAVDAPDQCRRLMGEMSEQQKAFGSKDLFPGRDTYNVLIDSYAKRGRAREAEETLHEMIHAGIMPTVVTFNMVIVAWGKSGSKEGPPRCMQLLTEMEQLVERTGRDDLSPDRTSYSSVAAAYAKRGLAYEAEDVLRRQQQCGVPVPDRIIYTTVMWAWCRSDEADGGQRCQQLLSELKQTAAQTGDSNLYPDVVVYSVVINALARRRHLREAEEVFFEMLRDGIKPNLQTVFPLISAYSRCTEDNAVDRCRKLLAEMNQLAATSSNELPRPGPFHYNLAIDAFARRGKANEAESLLRHMIQQGIQPDIKNYRTVMTGWAKANFNHGPERCLQIWREMQNLAMEGKEDFADTVRTYNIMTEAYANRGRGDEAEELLRQMPGANITPDVISYTTLLKAYAKSSNTDAPERCRQLLAEMRQLAENGNRPAVMPNRYTYNTVLDTYAKRGRVDDTKMFFEEMANSGVKHDAVSYTSLIRAYLVSDHKIARTKCKELLAEMKRLANERRDEDLQPDYITYRTIIEALANRNYPQDAEAILKHMLDDHLYPDAAVFKTVICSWAMSNETGAMDHCLSLLGDMKRLAEERGEGDLMPNHFVHNILLDGFAIRGQGRDAENHLRRMMEDGVKPSLVNYATVLKAWSNCEDDEAIDRCRQLFSEAKETTREHGKAAQATIGYMHNILGKVSTRGFLQKERGGG